MQTQEDLATLFSRNLSLHQPQYQDPAPESQIYQTTLPEEAITYSITQHYHHSAHIASKLPRAVSEPAITDQQTIEIILARHGVDITSLFPSQIDLFKTADPSQQMRLVELWRICPPNSGGHALAQYSGDWPATNFQQEEAMAKIRYEQQMMEERASRSSVEEHIYDPEDVMSDGEQSNAPLTPIPGGDSRWAAPEPYMTSGYETLAQREYEQSARQPAKDSYSHFGTAVGGPSYSTATDPVYKTVGVVHHESWNRTPEQQQEAMENQYGTFSHGREYSQGVGIVYGGQDEEML